MNAITVLAEHSVKKKLVTSLLKCCRVISTGSEEVLGTSKVVTVGFSHELSVILNLLQWVFDIVGIVFWKTSKELLIYLVDI
jgi:hypothetical protein